MMYIKIQGTVVPVLTLSVALHVTACRKSSVQVARATCKSVQGMQLQVTEIMKWEFCGKKQ